MGARPDTLIVLPAAQDATPFVRAAETLDHLSFDSPVTIATGLWAELAPTEQAELHRRAAARGVVLRNALGGTVAR